MANSYGGAQARYRKQFEARQPRYAPHVPQSSALAQRLGDARDSGGRRRYPGFAEGGPAPAPGRGSVVLPPAPIPVKKWTTPPPPVPREVTPRPGMSANIYPWQGAGNAGPVTPGGTGGRARPPAAGPRGGMTSDFYGSAANYAGFPAWLKNFGWREAPVREPWTGTYDSPPVTGTPQPPTDVPTPRTSFPPEPVGSGGGRVVLDPREWQGFPPAPPTDVWHQGAALPMDRTPQYPGFAEGEPNPNTPPALPMPGKKWPPAPNPGPREETPWPGSRGGGRVVVDPRERDGPGGYSPGPGAPAGAPLPPPLSQLLSKGETWIAQHQGYPEWKGVLAAWPALKAALAQPGADVYSLLRQFYGKFGGLWGQADPNLLQGFAAQSASRRAGQLPPVDAGEQAFQPGSPQAQWGDVVNNEGASDAYPLGYQFIIGYNADGSPILGDPRTAVNG